MSEILDIAARDALNKLTSLGADKAQCVAFSSTVNEFNAEGGEFSLYRTLFDQGLSMMVISGCKKGSVGVNRLDDASVAQAVQDCMNAAKAAQYDPAWDIAEKAQNRSFSYGAFEPDMEAFFQRVSELMAEIRSRHPSILIEQLSAAHRQTKSVYENTNGAAFRMLRGYYGLDIMYAAHEGEKSSSFFNSSLRTERLDQPLIALGSLESDFSAVEKQLDPKPVSGKFEGTVLFTPACLGGLLQAMLSHFAGDASILKGTSVWKDALGTQVADERVTIAIAPLDPRIVCGERVSGEGFLSKNYDVIRRGMLKSFMLSLYVANKTGRERAGNSFFSLVMEPGEEPLESLIRGIDRGLLVARFSGGKPAANGEFSGVAKNSFLIENGRVAGAVNETMISGNFADMLKRVIGISRETVADGMSVLPYAAFGGVTISGK